MEAYFDNSATTRCTQTAVDIMQRVLLEDYGNPSSLHMKGVVAENYIKTAREQIAKILKVSEKEMIFTSGGTESNNLALIGTALASVQADISSQQLLSMRLCTIRLFFWKNRAMR